MAIGSGSPEMQSTAQSALLQMLNTVLKRVGQQVGVGAYLDALPFRQHLRAAWAVVGSTCGAVCT